MTLQTIFDYLFFYLFLFFYQVTNQMITACKSYITENGLMTIWEQPTEELITKLQACIKLNHEYQKCFQKTKQKLESSPQERQFEFSEMYIFGKFDTFERRLTKIIDMFDTIEMFSHLSETRIEGKYRVSQEKVWCSRLLIRCSTRPSCAQLISI